MYDMGITNARQELENLIDGDGLKIEYAWININSVDDDYQEAKLKIGYSDEECEEFMKLINLDYDSGYGDQNVDGYVKFIDGSELIRREYDGSEWWEHHNSYAEVTSLNRELSEERIFEDYFESHRLFKFMPIYQLIDKLIQLNMNATQIRNFFYLYDKKEYKLCRELLNH